MKLKIDLHFTPSQIIWGIAIAVLGGFFLRTAIWENLYYNAKEGTPRAAAINNLEDEDNPIIDETPVTEAEVNEYTVAPDKPRYLRIPVLGITGARIRPVGLTASGAIATVHNLYDVGWYNASATPGTGGTIVIDGHSGVGQKGVFYRLPDLKNGDQITIERGDGEIFTYRVMENAYVPYNLSNTYMSTALTSPIPGVESLTLITCSGNWDKELNTYDHRTFIRAVLI